MKSYEILKQLIAHLIREGFDELPYDRPVNLNPYYDICSSYMPGLESGLTEDLEKIFHKHFDIVYRKIWLRENDGQEENHIVLRFALKFNLFTFQLRADCLLNHEAIVISFDDPNVFKLTLSNRMRQKLQLFHGRDQFNARLADLY